MGRKDIIGKFIDKSSRGIELGPWFSPLAAKRDGYNCLVMDVFDTDRLKANALNDPHIAREQLPLIEDVDLVGTSTNIADVVAARGELGAFDYIISSHNFEHIANPLKFLQGCGRVLKQGGMLSMAIPDGRACFDFYRPHSTMAQWIEAFFENRDRPTQAQIYEHHGSFALFNHRAPLNSTAGQSVSQAYLKWKAYMTSPSAGYEDAHCWVFTPVSCELLLREAEFLKLSPFSVVEVSRTRKNEFFVHLQNTGFGTDTDMRSAAYYRQRQLLLSKMAREPRYLASGGQRIAEMLRSAVRWG